MFKLTRDEQLAIAVALLIISVVIIAVFANRTDVPTPAHEVTVESSNTSGGEASNDGGGESPRMIRTHVIGEVFRPNVYTVLEGARVGEVVRMAGPKPTADSSGLNLARVVKDEEQIVVPRKGERKPVHNSYAAGTRKDGLININTASREELESLPGIGKTLADRIIEYREKRRFNRIEDITEVNRIGEKTFEGIKDRICVE